MNILHLMSTPYGGAANAALRLHLGLLERNIESKVLTIGKRKDIPQIYSYADISRWGWLKNTVVKKRSKKYYFDSINIFKGRKFTPEKFTLTTSPYLLENHPLVKNADIINLHWVAEFINYPTFFSKITKPIVWTFHDMNAFTGGCHYSFNCYNFIDKNCMNCPQIDGINNNTLANDIFNEKLNVYEDLNLTITAPSKWLFNESQRSRLIGKFKHYHIAYGMPDTIFSPKNRNKVREEYKLPFNKKIVLFVADSIDNYRKGIHFMLESSKLFSADVHFVLVGKGEFKADNFTHLGEVKSENKMAQIYSCVDLFVIPSLADNLPNTVLESLLCGTPVVGFNVGGIPDMIEDGNNGFICDEIDSNKLANNIKKALEANFDRMAISDNAKKKYSLTKQAEEYINIYKTLV